MDRIEQIKRKAFYLNRLADIRDLLAQTEDRTLSFTIGEMTYTFTEPDSLPGWSRRGSQITYRGYDGYFDLQPPLSDSEISEVESAYGITLPEDYRLFLMHIGNGGPGPYTPMNSLHNGIGLSTDLSDITKPFPYTSTWFPRLMDLEDRDYDDPRHLHGTLNISSYGGTMNVILIVNGAERGNVWMEDLGSDNGVWPIATADLGEVTRVVPFDLPHLSFFDWYEQALDEQIAIKEPIRRRLEQALIDQGGTPTIAGS